MTRSKHFYIRKTHRWLGVLLGVQFLIWTVSGLYFSWTNIDDIHGDFQRKQPPLLKGYNSLVSPTAVFQKNNYTPDSLLSIRLVSILGKPYYNLRFFKGSQVKFFLADALTGDLRPAISKEEAAQIAIESFNGDPAVKSVVYLTTSNGHHEYRGKPLPAWAVTFEHYSNTTVYVSAEAGKVESFRNNKWRIFDFLWMGHTMDYQGRDDINNWLLRAFSLFGLVTVLSGFLLYGVSTKRLGKKRV